jgi:chromosome segregation ATPase
MVTIEQLQEIVYQNAIGIAELREAQKKTDEQLKELKERMDQTDKQIKATEEQLKKTDEQLKKTDEQLKKTDEQLKKTDEQMNRTDVRLNKIAKLVGNMSNNQGEVAEEYFVNSLKDVLKIGELNFDYLLQNIHLQTKKVNDEFDILLVNGSSVAIIEVKYKVHPNVIDSLEKKIEHLKLMKEYKNYDIYAGVAGFKVPDEVIKKAERKGYFVLKRKGDIIEEYITNLIPA